MAKQDVFDEVQARKKELTDDQLESLGVDVPEDIDELTLPQWNELLDKIQALENPDDEEDSSNDGDDKDDQGSDGDESGDDKPEEKQKSDVKEKKKSGGKKALTVVADKRAGDVSVGGRVLKKGQEKKLTAEEMKNENLLAQIEAGVRSGLWSVK